MRADLTGLTPCVPQLPHLTHGYGNPHSRTHAYGWDAESAIEDARKQVADLCGADAKEMIFTSGVTQLPYPRLV
jgi:cysteine desulfurase